MTAREFLSQFGDFEQIEGIDSPIGNQEIVRWFFPLNGEGGLYVSCGGDCIIGFETTRIDRRPMYLVRDDTAGEAWAALRQDPTKIGRRPNARLRLVQTA